MPSHSLRDLNFRRARAASAQSGFTLVELTVAMVVLAVLVALALPSISSYMVSARLDSSVKSMQAAMVAVENTAAFGTATPYAGLTIKPMGDKLRNSAYTVSGAGAGTTVTHPMTAMGSAGGAVTLAPNATSDGAVLTLAAVNDAACPGFAKGVDRIADTISINGVSIKAAGATADWVAGQAQCTPGDTNTIVINFH